MTFVQLEFVGFFVIVLSAYWAVGSRRLQNLLLAVASGVFYGWVHPWFLLLLYGSATLDYSCGRLMAARPRRKRVFLVASLCGNLGMLATFKYYDFFATSFSDAATALGLELHVATLGLFLPVGISFYTFQTMGYTIDVYREQLTPRRDFLDYLVYVSFFPQLVAGPVERAPNLLPQVEAARRFDAAKLRSGLSLALWGAFKKICIADQISPYVDRTFALPYVPRPLVWAATLGFTLQILADFSAYTDIARGTARMLGFELMENFRKPYLAANPSELWQRWHISFSTWIRDYLYIPLGGSRRGPVRTLGATFGAMLLSGLWHGASWTFVLWGGYHAALLTGHRMARRLVPGRLRAMRGSRAWAVALMFPCTVFGWLLFRETDIARLSRHLSAPPWSGTREEWIAATALGSVTLALAAVMLAGARLRERAGRRLHGSPWLLPAQTTGWTVLAVAVAIFARDHADDFIYFQF